MADLRIVTADDFRDLLPRLDPCSYAELESQLRKAGRAIDPVLVWRESETGAHVIVDGHHRYEICTRLGLDYRVEEDPRLIGATRDAVKQHMLDAQNGKRKWSRDQHAACAVLHGLESEPCAAREQALDIAAANRRDLLERVLHGSLTMTQAYRDLRTGGVVQRRAPVDHKSVAESAIAKLGDEERASLACAIVRTFTRREHVKQVADVVVSVATEVGCE